MATDGEALSLATGVLAGVPTDGDVIALIRQALPWARSLPDAAVAELAADLAATLSQVLAEWQHTAEVYAEPDLYAILSRPYSGDFGSVPVPDPTA